MSLEKYLARIPEELRRLKIFKQVVDAFKSKNKYMPLNDYNGVLGFVIGVLYANGLADIVVVDNKIFFRLKKLDKQ